MLPRVPPVRARRLHGISGPPPPETCLSGLNDPPRRRLPAGSASATRPAAPHLVVRQRLAASARPSVTCFSTEVAAPIIDATSLRFEGTISVLPSFARLPNRSR